MHQHRQEDDIRTDLHGKLHREVRPARQNGRKRQQAEEDVADVGIKIDKAAVGAERDIVAQRYRSREQHQRCGKTIGIEIE